MELALNFSRVRLNFPDRTSRILHQAESTGGWRVLRSGARFDAVARTVNAAKFIKTLRRELKDYSSALATSEWEDLIARHARTKLDAICRNSEHDPH